MAFQAKSPLTKVAESKQILSRQLEEALTHLSNEQIRLESEILDAERRIQTAEAQITSNAAEAKRLQLLQMALGDES